MKILMGIILLHLLVILRVKITAADGVPYGSVLFLSIMTVTFVLIMMATMEMPEP